MTTIATSDRARPDLLHRSEPSAVRLTGLDAVRFVAIAGIVWRHTAEGLPVAVGFFGVPFFFLAALLLLGRSIADRPGNSLVSLFHKRFNRIYLPFAAWCVIYEVMRQSKDIIHGPGSFDHFTAWIILGGTYRHLWFLPSLLIVILVAAPLLQWAHASSLRRCVIAVLSMVGAGAFATLPVPADLLAAPPSGKQFLLSVWQAAPSAMLGLGLAALIGLGRWRIGWGRGVAVAGAFGVIATTALQWHLREPDVLLSTLGGLAALAMIGLGGTLTGVFAWLGRLSFGVYLAHVVFIRIGVQWLEHRNGAPYPFAISLHQAIALSAVALAGSLLVTLLLRRSRFTRWTIGE